MSTRQRYPSDLTDLQWENIEHLFPPERQPPGKPGRRRTYPRREVVNAVMYLSRAGRAWRMRPRDYPPWRPVCCYFSARGVGGMGEQVPASRRRGIRVCGGREGTPGGCVMDSRSVKTTEAGGGKGYDGGKK